MRILCLWFPRLSAQLAVRARPALRGRPFIVLAGVGGDSLVADASPEAAAQGALSGLSAGQSRAAVPGAAFLADNAAACLDELERITGILSARATTHVAVGGRDHIFLELSAIPGASADEGCVAARLAGIARAWSGVEVRAAVADTRAAALESARFARRRPVIVPSAEDEASAPEAPVLPSHSETLSARAMAPRSARALTGPLDAILAARGWTYRELTVTRTGADGPVTLRHRPAVPLEDVSEGLRQLGLGSSTAFDGAEAVELSLSRLGPCVDVQHVAASRRGRPVRETAALRRAG